MVERHSREQESRRKEEFLLTLDAFHSSWQTAWINHGTSQLVTVSVESSCGQSLVLMYYLHFKRYFMCPWVWDTLDRPEIGKIRCFLSFTDCLPLSIVWPFTVRVSSHHCSIAHVRMAHSWLAGLPGVSSLPLLSAVTRWPRFTSRSCFSYSWRTRRTWSQRDILCQSDILTEEHSSSLCAHFKLLSTM